MLDKRPCAGARLAVSYLALSSLVGTHQLGGAEQVPLHLGREPVSRVARALDAKEPLSTTSAA